MKTKQKIIDALGCALDDISEDRLLDILLDAYKAKKDRISQLEGENCHERLVMESERQFMHDERKRLHTDPTYGAAGQYFFVVNHHKIAIRIQGRMIEVTEKVDQVDYLGQQLSPAEWHSPFNK